MPRLRPQPGSALVIAPRSAGLVRRDSGPETAELLARLLARYQPATRRAYQDGLAAFTRWCHETGAIRRPSQNAAVEYLVTGGLASRATGPAHTQLVFEQWVEWLRGRVSGRGRPYEATTIALRIAAIRALLDLAGQIGYLTVDGHPVAWNVRTKGLRPRIDPYRDIRGPGDRWFWAMHDVADPRERAVLHLGRDIGLRNAEIRGLDLRHLDLDQGRIEILGKMRSQTEFLDLPAETVEALRGWIAERGAAPGPLFPSRGRSGRTSAVEIGRVVKRVARRAGVPGRMWPHLLRHWFGTRAAVVTGGNVPQVMVAMRHRNVAVTMRYIAVAEGTQGRVAALVARRTEEPTAAEIGGAAGRVEEVV